MTNAVVYYQEGDDVSVFAGKEKDLFLNYVLLQSIPKDSPRDLTKHLGSFAVVWNGFSDKLPGLTKGCLETADAVVRWMCKTNRRRLKYTKDGYLDFQDLKEISKQTNVSEKDLFSELYGIYGEKVYIGAIYAACGMRSVPIYAKNQTLIIGEHCLTKPKVDALVG